MNKIELKELSHWYDENRTEGLDSRWLNADMFRSVFTRLKSGLELNRLGTSFEGREINAFKLGNGRNRILLWTQMHGNESTGTRALLDLVKFFQNPGGFDWLRDVIWQECTLLCIPVLNPDGAQAYTRVNAQQIDLNRDVIDQEAVESRILMKQLKRFAPHYCLNLHDQRTLFSVGEENYPATMSFLAPSIDAERTVTPGRIETMKVIASVVDLLKNFIPNRIGRYTDEFYPTATGDNFQKMGHNTILIEAGHSKGDYQRFISRKATFLSLIEALRYISGQDEIDYLQYFSIPDNKKEYRDIIVKGLKIDGALTDLGIQYQEVLESGGLLLAPGIDIIDDLTGYNADKILDGSHLEFSTKDQVENWVRNEFN